MPLLNSGFKINKMKYTTIKWVLKKNIKNNVNTLWTWDREEKNFTQIYQNYNDKLPIYTASQLLNEIEKSESLIQTKPSLGQ